MVWLIEHVSFDTVKSGILEKIELKFILKRKALMTTNNGRVYWITGLAGAGKTTFGLMLREAIFNKTGQKSVFIDGDEIRAAFGNNFGYSVSERRKLAFI